MRGEMNQWKQWDRIFTVIILILILAPLLWGIYWTFINPQV